MCQPLSPLGQIFSWPQASRTAFLGMPPNAPLSGTLPSPSQLWAPNTVPLVPPDSQALGAKGAVFGLNMCPAQQHPTRENNAHEPAELVPAMHPPGRGQDARYRALPVLAVPASLGRAGKLGKLHSRTHRMSQRWGCCRGQRGASERIMAR